MVEFSFFIQRPDYVGSVTKFCKIESYEAGRLKSLIAKNSKAEPEIVIIATGSEVELALKSVKDYPNVRVVSMISRELFMKQTEDFRKNLIPENAKKIVIEAGVSYGWGDITGTGAEYICVDKFGESGPYPEVAKHFGFSVENVIEKIKKLS